MSAKAKFRSAARGTVGIMPDATQANIRRFRDQLVGLGQLKANQNMLAMRIAELEKQVFNRPVPEVMPADGRFPDHVRSRLCTQSQLDSDWFRGWCEAMDYPPHAHRKTWEFTYIAEVLHSLGMLEEGKRGVGFGVGKEPLLPLFASRGVSITATDLDADDQEATGWVLSNQHATGSLDDMNRPSVCSPEKFREHVEWRPANMRDIPADLVDYDFTWSACALEHVGTLQWGLDFIENSLKTLKPGGIAVHTTEFNVFSNDDTIESGATVVYREKDMIELGRALEAQGHEVAAFDFNRGSGVLDQYIDVPPFALEPVLRFQLGKYALTSVAIVVRKAV